MATAIRKVGFIGKGNRISKIMSDEKGTLSRDETRFLVGGLYLDSISRRRSLRALTQHLRFVAAARQSATISASQAAQALGLSNEKEVRLLLGAFCVYDKECSARYAAGAAFLDSSTLAGGIIAANWRLLKISLKAASKHCWATLAARFGTGGQRISLGGRLRARGAWARQDALGALIDEIHWNNQQDYFEKDGHRPMPGHKTGQHGCAEIGRDPLAEITDPSWADVEDSVGARAGGDRAWVRQWLADLGFANSGVRVEAYTHEILDATNLLDLGAVRTLVESGGELAAVGRLYDSVRRNEGSLIARVYLARLAGVLRCIKQGHPLPGRPNSSPIYNPLPGRLFYLTHMRGPYENNGYVTRSHLVLKALSRAGLEPMAFTRLGFPNDLARHRNASIDDEELVGDHVFRSLPDPMGGLLHRPIDNYISAYADRIVEMAKLYRPAAIHGASNYVNGLAAIEAARRLGIPAIYEVRGIWEITQSSTRDGYADTLQYALQRRLENEAVRSATRVITISEPLRRFVIEHGALGDNVSVVPNGVDSERLHIVDKRYDLKAELNIPADAVVIGYIGSVVHYEGLDLLIHAMARLRDAAINAPNLHFLLVGDGKALHELTELAAQLGVTDRCHFLGRVPHERVEALYSLIDVAPFPRRSLPVTELVPPLKPFEAMAGGKAVIVSSVEAIAGTVIDEVTGLIVQKNNLDALVAALKRLIMDPELRKRLGQQARIWVERERSVQSLSRQFIDVYRAVGAFPGNDARHG